MPPIARSLGGNRSAGIWKSAILGGQHRPVRHIEAVGAADYCRAVPDTLLRSIRERLLDESEPLAGLLRKCLLLGAETGSDALRQWARRELNGYDGEEGVPEYRKLSGVPISMDSISGNTLAKNQIVDRLNLPQESLEFVPEAIAMRQPIEELEALAKEKRLSFSPPGLAYAQMLWNQKLGAYQNIVSLSYVMPGTAIRGVLGQIRTQLVDLIADLTSDTPLAELPGKEQVDAAVSHHIGQVYNTTVHDAAGPLAIGTAAKASTEGLSIEDALKLLDAVRHAADDAEGTDTQELVEALDELRVAVEQESPDTGEVVKKVGKLRAVTNKLGVAAITAATSSATTTLTELAMNGAFN